MEYKCPRCGYKTTQKCNIRSHFARITECPGSKDPTITMTDEIKQCVLRNHVYKKQVLRCKYSEKLYQTVVENFLGGKHMKLHHCVTDVTTDKAHVEIKRWAKYVQCIGQLLTYREHSHREESHAYMFDESCGQGKMNIAVKTMKALIPNLKLYTFITNETSVQIVDYDSNTIVFDFKIMTGCNPNYVPKIKRAKKNATELILEPTTELFQTLQM